MTTNTCQYCHKELTNANAYEDGLYQIIGKWLCDSTCIPWYRYNSNLHLGDQQYGMMFLHTYSPSQRTHRAVQVGEGENENFCIAIEETEDFFMDLMIVREQGEPIRCEQPLADAVHRSASDLLKNINSIVGITEFTRDLRNNDIVIQPANRIENRIVMRDKVGEYLCEATFAVRSCRKTSYPVAGDELAYCFITCDGEPFCQAREYPDCV